jgi:stage III sporulation protein AB
MEIIKWILSILVVIVSAALGLNKSKKFVEREYILSESITLFKRLQNEIVYLLSPLPNAIESARINLNTQFKDVVGSIGLSILQGDFNLNSVEMELSTLFQLTQYDRQIIASGLVSLGMSDVSSQVGIIANTIELLEAQKNDAREEKVKNSKLYKTIGLISGVMIAIIFI